MEFLARVNARYFAGIQMFAAQQDVRYYLNGVYIEPHPEKGAVIVATDGHRLAAIHDPDWRRIVSTLTAAEGLPIPALNASYVASVSEALRIMDPTNNAPVVRLYGNGTECAVVARCGGLDIAERFVAVIMPLRYDNVPKSAIPNWMAPKAKPRLKYRGSELVTA